MNAKNGVRRVKVWTNSRYSRKLGLHRAEPFGIQHAARRTAEAKHLAGSGGTNVRRHDHLDGFCAERTCGIQRQRSSAEYTEESQMHLQPTVANSNSHRGRHFWCSEGIAESKSHYHSRRSLNLLTINLLPKKLHRTAAAQHGVSLWFLAHSRTKFNRTRVHPNVEYPSPCPITLYTRASI